MILILSNFCLYILSAYGVKDVIEIFKNKFKDFKPELIIFTFLIVSLIDIYRIDNRIINPDEDSGQQNQITSINNFELSCNFLINKHQSQERCISLQFQE